MLMLIRYAERDRRGRRTRRSFCVEALRYVVEWLLFPVLFYEIARRADWLDRYPRYIAALNWINLPAMIVAVIGVVVAIVLPPPAGSSLMRVGLQALFFYWFLVTTRHGARRRLAGRGAAAGRQLGAVALPLTARRPLSSASPSRSAPSS